MAKAQTIWGEFDFPEEPEIEEQEPKEDPKVEDKEPEEDDPKPKEEPKDQDPGEEEEESEYSRVASELAEQGLIEFPEEGEDLDDSPEGFAKLIQYNQQKALDKYKQELSEKTGGLTDAIEAGMSVEDWFASQQEVDYSNFDPEDDSQSKQLLTAYFKAKNFEADEIEDMIESLETTGKDIKKAEEAKSFLIKQSEKNKEAKVKQVEEMKAERQRQMQEVQEQYIKEIDSLDEVSGFKLNAKQKQEFKDYLFKPNPKTGKTKAQENDSPKHRIKLAVMSFIDANKEIFEKQAETKATRKLRKKLSESKPKGPKGTTPKANRKPKEELTIPSFFGGNRIEVED